MSCHRCKEAQWRVMGIEDPSVSATKFQYDEPENTFVPTHVKSSSSRRSRRSSGTSTEDLGIPKGGTYRRRGNRSPRSSSPSPYDDSESEEVVIYAEQQYDPSSSIPLWSEKSFSFIKGDEVKVGRVVSIGSNTKYYIGQKEVPEDKYVTWMESIKRGKSA